MRTRPYRQKNRALLQEQTRRRIVDATAALHAEVGPAATTISAIAERAGVQRLTVYRHFPDDAGLFAACAAHTAEQFPPPDPAPWQRIRGAGERTEAVLSALYGWYRARAKPLGLTLRDAESLPALQRGLAPMRRYLGAAERTLVGAWPARPRADRRFRAAVRHALHFHTWRSLAAEGLTDTEAVQLMTQLVATAARHSAGAVGPKQGTARA